MLSWLWHPGALDKQADVVIAISYPSLKYIRGCFWLFLQAPKGNVYFTELAERVECGNYGYRKEFDVTWDAPSILTSWPNRLRNGA